MVSVTSYTLGLFMIAKAPWYLLPLAWAWTGTAVTGVSSVTSALLIFSNTFSSHYFSIFSANRRRGKKERREGQDLYKFPFLPLFPQ